MATKKKTTKKTTSSNPRASRVEDRSTDMTPAPLATATPSEPKVEVRPYKHIGDQANAFMAAHPNGVYFHLDMVPKSENESAIKSLLVRDPKRPVFVDGRSFTAAELQALGFEVFQNGPGGKLVGIRGV